MAEESASVPLERIVLPQPMTAVPPEGGGSGPLFLRLVRDSLGRPRPASGVLCSMARLASWAEHATTGRLAALRAAWAVGPEGGPDDREVLVLGDPRALPAVPEGVRFWGANLLIPLGFRPDPELPEPALCRALGAGPDDLVVLLGQDHERIPRAAFQTLSRAAVRLARRGMGRGPSLGGRQP